MELLQIAVVAYRTYQLSLILRIVSMHSYDRENQSDILFDSYNEKDVMVDKVGRERVDNLIFGHAFICS